MESKQADVGSATVWNKDFICVLISNLAMCIAHSSVHPLVASYTIYLNAGPILMGLLTGMLYGTAFITRPIAGPAMTKLDKRKLLIFAYILGIVAHLGYALFQNIAAFSVFRFVSGVQYGLFGALLVTLAAQHLPRNKMAFGMGMLGFGIAVGSAIGPIFGESILLYGTNQRDVGYGFSLVFLFGLIINVISIIPVVLLSPDKKSKADIASTGAWYKNFFSFNAAYMAAVLLLVLMSQTIILAYVIELAYEQGIEGISTFFVVYSITLAIAMPLSGFLADKLGVQRVIYPALAIYAISMLVIGSSVTLMAVLVGAVLAGIGHGSVFPALQTMSMRSEPALRRGVASNTIYMGIDIGSFFGPFIGGIVYAHSDYSFMFKTGAVPPVLAIIFFIIILPRYRRRLNELGY